MANFGTFALFSVFLRYDLAINYVHHDCLLLQTAHTILYVIQPQLLLEYKRALVQDCMFVLTDKNEWEMDLLNNPRYHPNERIKFLKLLTNSTSFCLALMELPVFVYEAHTQASMARTVDRLYNSFDNFRKDWMLDKYDDLKDNIEKQTEIHEEFKYYIQYLFGIGQYLMDIVNMRDGNISMLDCPLDTITESNTNGICDSSGLGIGTRIENGFKFVDLNDDMIKNERDLTFFVETLKMTHDCDEAHILENLENSPYNSHLNKVREKFGNKGVYVPVFKFDRVSDIYKFFQRRWNFK